MISAAMWAIESYRTFSSIGGPLGLSAQQTWPFVALGVLAELGAGAVVAFAAHVAAQRGPQGRRWFVTLFNGFGLLFGGLSFGVRWTQLIGILAAVAAIVSAWWDPLASRAASRR